MSDSAKVSDKRLTRSRKLLREIMPCPLCGRAVSLHFLKYRHVCRNVEEITDEARERALEDATVRLRRRVGVVV